MPLKLNNIFIGQRSHLNEKLHFHSQGRGREITLTSTPVPLYLTSNREEGGNFGGDTHGVYSRNNDEELIIPKQGLYEITHIVKIRTQYSDPTYTTLSGQINFTFGGSRSQHHYVNCVSRGGTTHVTLHRPNFAASDINFNEIKLAVYIYSNHGGDWVNRSGVQFTVETLIRELNPIVSV